MLLVGGPHSETHCYRTLLKCHSPPFYSFRNLGMVLQPLVPGNWHGLLFVKVCPCFSLPTSLSVTLILALHASALSSSEQPKPQTIPPLFLPQDLGTCYPHCLECSFLGPAPGQLHTLTQRGLL